MIILSRIIITCNMKIAIMTNMPRKSYSGGRYYAYILAECLAHMGNTVYFVTDAFPIFAKDFINYSKHDSIVTILTDNYNVFNRINSTLDYVFVIPDLVADVWYYKACNNLAIKSKGKLVFVNFESPNWFNLYAENKRDESRWEGLHYLCRQGALVLSMAYESMQYAQEYFNRYPNYTRFDVWYPAINSLVADTIQVEKEKRIVTFVRLHDIHKGSNEVLKIISQPLSGYSLVFIVGNGIVHKDYIKELNKLKEKYGFEYQIKRKLSDIEKFYEIKRAQIMLFPSLFEGYGYPPIEAQYCDTLCIAYDLPVLREINGNGILYCKYGDTGDMKNRLCDAITGKISIKNMKEGITDKGNFQRRASAIHNLLTLFLDDDWRNPEAKYEHITLSKERSIRSHLRKKIKYLLEYFRL